MPELNDPTQSTPRVELIEPAELSDGTTPRFLGQSIERLDCTGFESDLSVDPGFGLKDQIKERVREFVSDEPERAVLTAVAAGALLTGLLRYLVKRKKYNS
jgi:hypothetical protein